MVLNFWGFFFIDQSMTIIFFGIHRVQPHCKLIPTDYNYRPGCKFGNENCWQFKSYYKPLKISQSQYPAKDPNKPKILKERFLTRFCILLITNEINIVYHFLIHLPPTVQTWPPVQHWRGIHHVSHPILNWMSWLNPHLALNPHTPLHYPLKSIKEKKHLKEFKGILFIPLKYFHQYNVKSTHTQTKWTCTVVYCTYTWRKKN